MKNRLVNIKLHGRLGEEVGSDWNFDIRNAAEGFRAVEVMSKYKFNKTILQHYKEGINYKLLINGRDFTCDQNFLKNDPIKAIHNSEIFLNRKDLRTIDIVPVIEGAIWTAIIIAVVLIIAAVAVYFLTPLPDFSDFREIDGTIGKTSYLFNGPQNTSREGGPVQIGYGRLIVGSQVIASSYSIKNIPASSLDIVVPGAGDTSFDLKDNIGSALLSGLELSNDYGAIAMHTETGEGAYLITVAGATIIKIGPNGNLIRRVAYIPNNINNSLRPNVIHVLSDNSILVASGNRLYKLVKILEPNTKNADGVVLDTYALSTTFGNYAHPDDTDNERTGYLDTNGLIRTITVLSTNSIIIGGEFTTISNTNTRFNTARAVKRIAKLDTEGTLDVTTFNSTGSNGFDKTVWTIIKDASDDLYVGGQFTEYHDGTTNTTGLDQIVKLNSNGDLDTTFVTNVDTGPSGEDDTVFALGLQTSAPNTGKLIVGGSFVSFDGVDMTHICRLLDTGALDTSFTNLSRLKSSGEVRAILIQSTDKIIIGGSFNGNSQPANPSEIGMRGLCRLNSDGKLDITFDSGGDTNGGIRGSDATVFSIINEVGKNRIYIAGDFSRYNSKTDNFPVGLARIKVD